MKQYSSNDLVTIVRVVPTAGFGQEERWDRQENDRMLDLIGTQMRLEAVRGAVEARTEKIATITVAWPSGATLEWSTEAAWPGHEPRKKYTPAVRLLTEDEIQRVIRRAREVESWPHIRAAISALTEQPGSPTRLAIAKALGVDAQ